MPALGAKPVLVTGAAGFIGFHTARRLLDLGVPVVGLDNLNAYYDPRLKTARLAEPETRPGFSFAQIDIADRGAMDALFRDMRPSRVIHLAAQAGVRHSITHPHSYADANLTGFVNVLEGCRGCGTEHLVYASPSSVCGANTRLPFSVHDTADHPLSLYAATKRANELMAHTYSHLYRLPTTGLRFFTVYGPWGRPDTAMFLFADAISEGREIQVFNRGAMRRDFTYVDDVTEALVRLLDQPAGADLAWNGAAPDVATSSAPYRLYNVGNSEPVELLRLIRLLESAIGQPAKTRLMEMQPGDVVETYAEVSELAEAVDFAPRTPIGEGVARFVSWYRDIYVPLRETEMQAEA